MVCSNAYIFTAATQMLQFKAEVGSTTVCFNIFRFAVSLIADIWKQVVGDAIQLIF